MSNLATLKRLGVVILIVTGISVTEAQDLFSVAPPPEKPCAPLLQNVQNRTIESLDGTWNALIDPAIFSLNDLLHFAERDYKAGPGELVEVDLDNGLTLKVPGDWNSQDDRLFFYNGKVWYKRHFYIKSKDNNRHFLHFGAVNYRAEIYVNGQLAGTHTGGYTSFNCEITDFIDEGENLVVVKVNNTLTSSDIPTTRTDWLNYGGITRSVNLVTTPIDFIENYKIQLAKDAPNNIEGWIKLNGDQSGSVQLTIPELGIAETISIENGRGTIQLTANPTLWTPEQPQLYEVTLAYGKDQLTDHIGFRTIAVKKGQVFLNDNPVFLRGISLHEEAIGANGRATSRQEAVELLTYAKELNCNYVRLAHYTHNEHMLKVADEMGLLVWAEIPVYWNLEFDNPEVMSQAQSRMLEMISRDQNRASIIFWSLGNETPISEARTTFFRQLNEYVKSVDDTRLTTAALVFGGEEIQEMAKQYFFPTMQGQNFETWDIEIKDPLASIVDVAAINQYFGWYYSGFLAAAAQLDPLLARQTMLKHMTKVKFHIPNNKPFVFSELGAGAKKGMKGNPDGLDIFSEAYQALVYRKQIEMIKQQDGLVGMTPWILKDFRSPMRLNQGIQDYWNRKGLITDNGERKQAFFVLRDFYEEMK